MTPTQRENLEKLAAYLERLPTDYTHFHMASFVRGDGEDPAALANYALHNGGVAQLGCGTIACAVGHGPAAGVLFRDEDFLHGIYLDWTHYSERFADDDTPAWHWLFAGDWDDVDNTHRGAAARIRYILAGRPIPDDFCDEVDEIICPQEHHVELYQDLIVS